MDDTTRQSVLFPDLFRKLVVARFDERGGRSGGGAILHRAIDPGLGLTKRLAGGLSDLRDQARIAHEQVEYVDNSDTVRYKTPVFGEWAVPEEGARQRLLRSTVFTLPCAPARRGTLKCWRA
jgi:hypothetical protein